MVLEDLEWINLKNHFLVAPHSPGGGGLYLAWRDEVTLTVNSSSDNYIDTTITYRGSPFHATFVYGEPDHTKRQVIWSEILNLQQQEGEPWFLTGDFNEILSNAEKQGGPARAEGTFCSFRTFMSQNGLFDLKHCGNFLSWRGKRRSHLVHCRLDRAISNAEWTELFPSCRSQYLRYEGSDHRPILSFLDPTRK